MRRYYKEYVRDVYRTLWQKEDSDLWDTSSVYLRSDQHTAPWIGHQMTRGGQEKRGRLEKTWQTTFKEDLQLRGISWCEVETTAADKKNYRPNDDEDEYNNDDDNDYIDN